MRLFNKRDLYFFFEKISLGQAERVFIYVLFAIILIIQIAILSTPFLNNQEQEDYTELNKLISERTEKMQQSFDSVLASQYYPTEKEITTEMESETQTKKSKPKSIKPKKDAAPILININSATLTEWIKVPGIGEKTAQLILDYRLKMGSFKSIDELKNVKGIGPKKLEKLRPFIKLDK